MCRWLSYVGAPIFLESLLFEPDNSLIQQSLHANLGAATTNGDGFGIGWYGDRNDPGLYREVLPAWNDSNLRNLSHQIRSGFFLAHVRASTGTDTSRVNCHPFRHGKWLFMHNGQIGEYGMIRRALELLIPEEVYPYRRGNTDSELFFYLLFRHGLERDPIEAMRRSVADVKEAMQTGGVETPFMLTCILADGARAYAVRYATEGEPPSLFWRVRGDGLLVVSEPLDDQAACWEEVPPCHVLITEGYRETVLRPFSVS